MTEGNGNPVAAHQRRHGLVYEPFAEGRLISDYCSQVTTGEGRVGTCLLQRKDKVDDECRAAMDDIGLEMIEE